MTDVLPVSGGRMTVPRTRGAVSGLVLIVLGLWGGLVPFLGPYFHFAFTPRPGDAWHWTAARGWFEVLPGGVAVLGGLLLLVSANRLTTLVGAWIAIAAGAWFVVGPQVSPLLTLGRIGSPAQGGRREHVIEQLAYFTALGVLIVLFAALAAGRLSVRSVRDLRAAAARRDAEPEREPEVERDADPAPERDVETAPERDVETRRDGDGDVPGGPPEAVDEPSSDTADQQPGHTEPSEPPSEPSAPESEPALQQDGPGYASPQRYVRAERSQQIPVEQLRRDHPTDGQG